MTTLLFRRAVACVSLALALTAPTGAANPRSEARSQVEFGITNAMLGNWREAIFRWEKAVQIDPTYAAAFNNLAVAYEHEGKFEKAKDAYERAMKLDPKNTYIKQNLEYFKEINDRANRQPPR